jgi:hypothetical protein
MVPDQNTFLLGEFELVAAYVLLAAILLSIAIWNRVRWWIRAGTIVVTFGFFFVTYVSVKNLLGWPTSELLPDRFEIIYAIIREPDEVTRSPGAIYVWAMTLPGEGPVDEADIYNPAVLDTRVQPDQMPRAYRLAYDRMAHKLVNEAIIQITQGVRQIGFSTRKPRKPGEYEEQSKYSFYDRPNPILPPKAAERPRE